MPTVFDRISNIVRANINDMLDNAEDPEAMLNQIIRDMNDALRQADSDIADQIAQQKMLEGDLEAAQRNAAAWQDKAELAVSKNRDDLAREALMRVNDFNDHVALYTKQLEAQKSAVQQLKAKRDQLKSKYDSAVRNKEMLVARAKSAQAQMNMTHMTTKTNTADYASELDRMERRIRNMEARAQADEEVAESKTTVEDEFSKLGSDEKIEEQLAALKAQMGKTTQPAA
ncbi:MAG TPA: PspA/IM30 family protein [Anaerolineae bacterium]|nr:PspA/IM30 family protein [Anaerolineae bacterium]